MTYDPDKHHRRSIRLKGFDYSRSAVYSVTICVQNLEYLRDRDLRIKHADIVGK